MAPLLADRPRPVPILGSAGTGKTTVALAAFHDTRIQKRFGSRRWFIRCHRATSCDALISEAALTIGIDPGSNLEQRVLHEITKEAALLVLDNVETPWEADLWAGKLEVEEFLSRIGQLPHLHLVVTVRGEQRPIGTPWSETVHIGALPLEGARLAFATIADTRFLSDPDLNYLLEAVDCLPLAILLLAFEAQSEPDLKELRIRWQKEGIEILRRGGQSLEASLELSVRSLRMTDEAKTLLSLLGVLPDGIAHRDLPALHSARGESAAATLRQIGLAYSSGSRIAALAPIRNYIRLRYAPSESHLARAICHYLALAESGKSLGTTEARAIVQRLAPELGNLDMMVTAGLESLDPTPSFEAALALAQVFLFTGLGSAAQAQRALTAARARKDFYYQARCLEALADIDLLRSRYEAARDYYMEAAELYVRAGDNLGKANCLKSLGDILFQQVGAEAAVANITEALVAYKLLKEPLGTANCVRMLGEIEFHRGYFDRAAELCAEARSVYADIHEALGEATCIKNLGRIALERYDYETASSYFEDALQLYRLIGSVGLEADCITDLGDLSLRLRDSRRSLGSYEKALPLYLRVGDVLGQANSQKRFGDVAMERRAFTTAASLYGLALSLYESIGSTIGKATCILGLGNVAAIRSNQFEAARLHYQEALTLYDKMGLDLGRAKCLKAQGDLALRSFRPKVAQMHFEEVLPLLDSIGSVHVKAECLFSLGIAKKQNGEPIAAKELYEKSLLLFKAVGLAFGEAMCQQALGDLAYDCLDLTLAATLYHQALAILSRLDEPYSLGWCFVRLAGVSYEEDRKANLGFARAAWDQLYEDRDLLAILDRAIEEGAGVELLLQSREHIGGLWI